MIRNNKQLTVATKCRKCKKVTEHWPDGQYNGRQLFRCSECAHVEIPEAQPSMSFKWLMLSIALLSLAFILAFPKAAAIIWPVSIVIGVSLIAWQGVRS